MKKILVPIAEGFEEIELVSIVDILRRAEVSVTLASLQSHLEVLGAHQIAIKADRILETIDICDFDGIVLAGGMGGVQNMQKSSRLKEMIVKLYGAQKLVAGICAAPIILDELGLLQKDFCCYPGCEKMMSVTKAKRLDEPVAQDFNLITATGPAFAIDFALQIVLTLLGEEKLNRLKNELLYC